MKHRHTALIATLGCLLTALIVLSLPTGTVAQQAGGGNRIAVCDLVEIFNNYERSTDLVQELNDWQLRVTDKMTAMDTEIETLEKLLTGGIKKDGQEYQEQYEIYREKVIAAQIWVEMEDARLKDHHLTQRREIYQEALDTIEAVAKQEGYSLVLFRDSRDSAAESMQEFVTKMQSRKVLYNADSLDITSTVLNKMNLAYQRR